MDFPRIIHQTWKTQELPTPIKTCVDSVQRINPEWDHHFYTDSDWKNFIESQSMIDWESFSLIPTGIQKADLFRCIALYQQGGVYSDVDMLALRPIDSMIHACIECGIVDESTELILTTDHPAHSQYLFGGREILMNHFMIAKPGARALRLLIEQIANHARNGWHIGNEPLKTTGPIALTQLVEEHGGLSELNISVVPYFWLHPLPDMSWRSPVWESFDKIIRDQSWKSRFCPYFAHLWWHSNWSRSNMMEIYGDLLFH